MRYLAGSKGIAVLLSSSFVLSVVDGAYDHFQVMGAEEADEEDAFLEKLLQQERREELA